MVSGVLMPLLEYLRPFLVLTMLGYASYKDLKTREINDILWVVFGALGLVLDVYEVVTNSLPLLNLAPPLIFILLFALLTGYLGFFGGADLLAFITLGLLQPYTPRLVGSYIGFAPVFFPSTLISNSIVVAASASILVLLENLSSSDRDPLFSGHEAEPAWRKLVLLISARRVDILKVRGPPFQYPLEYRDSDTNELRLRLRPDLDDSRAMKIIEDLRGLNRPKIWVSHTLPFLVALLVGYVVSVTFGDVLLSIISRLLG
jgi:preflagellin peptidase FlaK